MTRERIPFEQIWEVQSSDSNSGSFTTPIHVARYETEQPGGKWPTQQSEGDKSCDDDAEEVTEQICSFVLKENVDLMGVHN